jgi:Na+-driven multidrug efflux pump
MASLCHWTLSYSFCIVLDMRMKGVACATAFYFVIRFLIRLSICHYDKEFKNNRVSILDEKSWKDLIQVHRVGFNTMSIKVMSWWAFDIFTYFAASLRVEQLAAQAILKNIGLLSFMIPVGLTGASTFIIGYYVGKGKADIAKKASTMSFLMTLSWSFISVLVLHIFRE